MTRYSKELSIDELKSLQDNQIDFSDIPELDENFWHKAKLIEPDSTEQVTLRVKKSVLQFFTDPERKGYQTRINHVLESYVKAHPDQHPQ